MEREDTIFSAIIVSLFTVAAFLLVWETRPIWAGRNLVHEGNLTGYTEYTGQHLFSFEDGTTMTLDGWMWKTDPRLNRIYALYRKGPAIVLEEKIEPVIT